jgi:CubicO group peptidase (beta-lactamase class C family)
MSRRNVPIIVAALLALAPRSAAAQEPYPGLEAYIARAMAAWHVPGLGVAIVRNDTVIYVKGFGLRRFDSTEPVDENTLFEIGSSSKAFTATLTAMMVSDGRMRFDDRIGDYLPAFRLADPVANAEVTLRDGLSHRSGIGRGELIWLGAGIPRDEVLRRTRFLQPESPFRSRYSYQNILYLAVGEATARAAGTSWEELVVRRIFEPLGMRASLAKATGSMHANVAHPHGSARDSVFLKPFLNADNIAPAGSILSSARDMAQWVRFQLGDGEFEGRRLLDATVFRETHSPQILMPPAAAGGAGGSESPPITVFSSYAMGWMIQDYRRALFRHHGGNTDGSTAMVAMLPEHRIGVVVLANMAGAQLPGLLTRYIFDRHLGLPERDWSGEAHARMLAQRARADSAAAAQPERRAAVPPLPLTAYEGVYADSMYGRVSVRLQDGRLELRRGEWYGPLEFWNGSNFRWTILPSAPLPPLFLKFDVDPQDRVTGLYFGIGSDVSLLGRVREPDATPAGSR